MPEYLAPGVYVEETSYRAKSIEGVSTSTAGFVGPTRTGPTTGQPELLTSRADFERIFGDEQDLVFAGTPQPNYLAHAVAAFFSEGGRRLYVQRIFNGGDNVVADSHARQSIAFEDPPPAADTIPLVRARFPGRAGNLRVQFNLRVGRNALTGAGGARRLTRVREFDVVWAGNDAGDPFRDNGLFVIRRNAAGQFLLAGNGGDVDVLAEAAVTRIHPVSVIVLVEHPVLDSQGLPAWTPPELLGEFGLDPRSASSLRNVLAPNPPTRYQDLTVPIAIEWPAGLPADEDEATRQMAVLLLGTAVLDTIPDEAAAAQARRVVVTLAGGTDGGIPNEAAYAGNPAGIVDYMGDLLQRPKNGLLAFEAVEDISIVAGPGFTGGWSDNQADQDRVVAIQNAVINHCETMRYRVAVLDTPPNFRPGEALDYRNRRSSTHAAIYYPWVTVTNPVDGSRLQLPPSGFVSGIYARNDIEHAVFKAPANEVVRTAIDFELRLNKAQQEVLNPEGVNCFRKFEGRGLLLWGARTISDDPEWKYVSLRRYFAYLEHSIDNSTQWCVFENNGPRLWDNVRRAVEDFLFNEWKMGGLLGGDPKSAYFVRCDLSTMTQNDLDNGRLVCLIGVAPVRPAEFVIFRIGQWTADSPR
jgi:phage tail sheath protein FI